MKKSAEKLRFPKRFNGATVTKKTVIYAVLVLLCLTFIVPYL